MKNEKPKHRKAQRWRLTGKTDSDPKPKSVNAGNQYYTTLGTVRKESFKRGANDIADYMLDLKKEGKLDNFSEEEISQFRNKSTEENPDYNDELSQKVWGFLSQSKGNKFIPDAYSDTGRTQLGANVVESVGKFHYDDYVSDYTDNEIKSIKKQFPNYDIDKILNDKAFSNDVDKDTGYKYWTMSTEYDKDNDGYYNTRRNVAFVTDRDGNFVDVAGDFKNEDLDGGYYDNIRVATNRDIANEKNVPYLERFYTRNNKNQYSPNEYKGAKRTYSYHDDMTTDGQNIWESYNNQKDEKGNRIPMNLSLDGRTTRYYAVGGTTGEQIPIGEVEQPNDYNMVGEGGTHEQNPMGGVPYGVNQDGTQNMVEEGEVSVGNNVFSDRTQMSPELCQQLGLPEGTTPAQAMQQIEALYEQGQIGDEEFQEIQQIIFQDQEAQKQGAEGNIEQMQSEMPSEGIQPDMMQGASMPPEMMQQGAQPMQPPMQQGAPEGIQPDMIQGYGFGGRRWGCR